MYLGVNLRTVQKIRKELDESNGDYEGRAARKPHCDRSNMKRTAGFLGEIEGMIDNYFSGSIRSISRTYSSVWVSYQTGSAWRLSVFVIHMRKDQFFYHTIWRIIKTFEQTQAYPPTEYTLFSSAEKYFCHNQKMNLKDNRWFTLPS